MVCTRTDLHVCTAPDDRPCVASGPHLCATGRRSSIIVPARPA